MLAPRFGRKRRKLVRRVGRAIIVSKEPSAAVGCFIAGFLRLEVAIPTAGYSQHDSIDALTKSVAVGQYLWQKTGVSYAREKTAVRCQKSMRPVCEYDQYMFSKRRGPHSLIVNRSTRTFLSLLIFQQIIYLPEKYQ